MIDIRHALQFNFVVLKDNVLSLDLLLKTKYQKKEIIYL